MFCSMSTELPSRSKIAWGRTIMVISKSPAGPPFAPALPAPWIEMVCPSSIPAGTLTVRFFARRTLPMPWQVLQG